MAKDTPLKIQGTSFAVDLHILPIHGPDIILGMRWLESLGKVTADFVHKTLEFVQGDKQVFLQGIKPPPRRISLQSMSIMAAHSEPHEIFELVQVDTDSLALAEDNSEQFPVETPDIVPEVLEQFRGVFKLPTEMPPRRIFDHRIHLLPDTKPINVRPYRYPYFQKTEIERQVREMLEQGIIRHRKRDKSQARRLHTSWTSRRGERQPAREERSGRSRKQQRLGS